MRAASLQAGAVCLFAFSFVRPIKEAGCEKGTADVWEWHTGGVSPSETIQQNPDPEAGVSSKG